VVLEDGELARAVLASCSAPGLLPPVSWDGRALVDGGLLEPVPVSAARRMGAERVIAVDLSAPPAPPRPRPRHLLSTLARAAAVMQAAMARHSAAAADVRVAVVSPGAPGPSFRDYTRGELWRARGAKAVQDARHAIAQVIPEIGPEAWVAPDAGPIHVGGPETAPAVAQPAAP